MARSCAKGPGTVAVGTRTKAMKADKGSLWAGMQDRAERSHALLLVCSGESTAGSIPAPLPNVRRGRAEARPLVLRCEMSHTILIHLLFI